MRPIDADALDVLREAGVDTCRSDAQVEHYIVPCTTLTRISSVQKKGGMKCDRIRPTGNQPPLYPRHQN